MIDIPTFSEIERARFAAYALKGAESECWAWTGRKLKTTGRGQFRARNKIFSAPRIAFAIWKRPLVEGEAVLHSCDNPNCVNPHHLWAGTQLDNIQDRDAKGRNRLSATHCQNGHALTPDNTSFFGPDKRWRKCRACGREFSRKHRAKQNIEAENH